MSLEYEKNRQLYLTRTSVDDNSAAELGVLPVRLLLPHGGVRVR